MVRRSPPFPNRCVANEWRKAWGVVVSGRFSAERSLRCGATTVRLLRADIAVRQQADLSIIDPLGDGPFERLDRDDGAVVLRSAAADASRTGVFERIIVRD